MSFPRKIGPFTLTRRLGTDGVTESFVAVLDEPAGKQVVVHRLLPWLLRDSARLSAVEARVQDLTGIRHPGLVPITDYVVTRSDDAGSGAEERFIVEESVDALDLDRVLQWCKENQRPLPHNIFLNLATQICNGLEALHGRPGKASGAENVLHLGIQPSAVYLAADGKLLLSGYGLSRSPTSLPSTSLSESGGETGSFKSPGRMEYLSPEQTHPDQKLSPASDIFSLGSLLYELLTLEPLFRAESNLQTIHRVRRAEVTTPLLRVKEILPGLDKVLYRALSLNPRHRYQRAFVLREDLRGLMSGYSFARIVDDTREFLAPLYGTAVRRTTSTSPREEDPETNSLIESAMNGGLGHGDDTAALIRRAQDRAPEPPLKPVSTTIVPADPNTLFDDTTGEVTDAPPSGAYPTITPAPAGAYATEPRPAAPPANDPPTSWEQRPVSPVTPSAPVADDATSWTVRPNGAAPAAPPVQSAPAPAPKAVPPRAVVDPAAFDDEVQTAQSVPKTSEKKLAASAPPPPKREAAKITFVDEDVPEGGSNLPMIAGIVGALAVAAIAVVVCTGFLGGGAAWFGSQTVATAPGTPPAPIAAPADVETPPPAPVVAPSDVPPPVEPTTAAVPVEPTPVEKDTVATAKDPVMVKEPVRTAAVAPQTFEPRPQKSVYTQPATDYTSRTVTPTPQKTTPTSSKSIAAFNVEPPTLSPPDDAGIMGTLDAGPPDLVAFSDKAHRGALTDDDRTSLQKVATDDPTFSRTRILLYEDAKARGDSSARKSYLDAVMAIPENQYNPALLVEQAELAVQRRDWKTAIAKADSAERQWQRLPSDLVFSRKTMIYECQAAGWQGVFYDSGGENLDALQNAIRSWEKYQRHVDTKSRKDLSMKAEEELAKLTDMQRRLE